MSRKLNKHTRREIESMKGLQKVLMKALKETKEGQLNYIDELIAEKQDDSDECMEWYCKGIRFGYEESYKLIEELFDKERIEDVIVSIVSIR